MRLYLGPLLWLIMGVAVLASHAYTGSSRFRARVFSDRLAEVRKASSQRLMTVVVLGVGLFCTPQSHPHPWRGYLVAVAPGRGGPVRCRRPQACRKH